MGWSIPVIRIAGTMVRIHITFVILILWIGAAYWLAEDVATAVTGTAFVLAVFFCVLLHEFGHILMARRFGIATPDVTLLPIGGVANIAKMPEDPRQELLIAVAGPFVNLVIALLLIVAIGGFGALGGVETLWSTDGGFLERLAIVNIFLAVFNLIPAFPMDGGRVLRALLAKVMGFTRATRMAVTIGQGVAFLFGLIGLFGNPFLIFIGIFVYVAATSEAYIAETRSMAHGHRVRDGMISRYAALDATSEIEDAVNLLVHTAQTEFPITDNDGRPLGLLTRQGMIVALKEHGPGYRAIDAADPDFPLVLIDAPLDEALDLLTSKRPAAVGVTDRYGRLVGLVTMENISEMVMIDMARQKD